MGFEPVKKALRAVIASPLSGGADDLPRYVKTKHGATSNGAKGREVVVDTIENMDLAQGEKVGPDTYTLVRNSNKKNFDRSGPLRESLVGMKEGVPGIYSGYQRTEKRYSKLDRTGKGILLQILEVY